MQSLDWSRSIVESVAGTRAAVGGVVLGQEFESEKLVDGSDLQEHRMLMARWLMRRSIHQVILTRNLVMIDVGWCIYYQSPYTTFVDGRRCSAVSSCSVEPVDV